jgi:hypothetical protein
MNNLQKNSILELDGKIFKKIKLKKNIFLTTYFQNGIFSYLTLKSKDKVKRTFFLCATLHHIMMHIDAKYKGIGT